MMLVGLDLDSTRALAVAGPTGVAPRELYLDDGRAELPMAISLEGRRPEGGRAGAGICRRLPHLACVDFLAHLGDGRRWTGGRRPLDAEQALTLILERIQPACAGAEGMAAVLPAYLGSAHRKRLEEAAEKLRTRRRSPLPPLLGTACRPLALAAFAHEEHPWDGLALVGEVDEHGLTWTAVSAANGQISYVAEQALPHLGLRAWKERILNAVADRCIRQSRRDPRDSGQAEQSLYEQIDAALDASRQGRMVELIVQAEHWYQNLILRPEDFGEFTNWLVRQTADALRLLVSSLAPRDPVRTVFLTAACGRLPGLATTAETEAGVAGTVLPADAGARAAHDLAGRIHRGELGSGHLGHTVPLSASSAPDDGPPYQRVIAIRAVER